MSIHTMKLPIWLPEEFIGAEGDDDQSDLDDSGDSQGGDDSGDDDEDASGDSDDSAGSGDDSSQSADDRKELKEALAKERKANKEKERRLRKLEREARERQEAEGGELEAAKARAQRLEEQNQRLAQGLLKSAIDSAIKKAAEKAGFIDVTDAIVGVDRTKLDYSQDEEDPSDIDLDEKAIAKAVKDLAAKKPHFIRQGTDDGEATGSTFGRAGGRKQKKTTEDDLRQRYPALNN